MKLLNKIKCALFTHSQKRPPHLIAGRKGERYAARYLRRRGYRIVCRNFTSGKNEIDLIAKTKTHYVFCEVKTRMQTYGESTPFGRPASAVDADKKRHLIAAATTFYHRHQRENMQYRFDVLEVYMTEKQRPTHIHHIKGAFTR
jgi:putative endonuclease